MGDEELDCRVRNGIGYTLFSMDTSKYVYCPQADNVIALVLIYQDLPLGKHFFQAALFCPFPLLGILREPKALVNTAAAENSLSERLLIIFGGSDLA